MSKIGVSLKLRCWAMMSMKQTRKIELQRIQLLNSRTPLKIVKKHFMLWNRSILMSEIGVRPKLRFWAQSHRWVVNGHKKSDFKEFSFWAHEPLRNGKKNMAGFGITQFWCPRYELGPNYDVGQRWAWNRRKKWDFDEFSFWAHEPLGNGKKTCQALESLNSAVRDRS